MTTDSTTELTNNLRLAIAPKECFHGLMAVQQVNGGFICHSPWERRNCYKAPWLPLDLTALTLLTPAIGLRRPSANLQFLPTQLLLLLNAEEERLNRASLNISRRIVWEKTSPDWTQQFFNQELWLDWFDEWQKSAALLHWASYWVKDDNSTCVPGYSC